MKLIDLLVQELPRRGGWPEGVGHVEMHSDGDIFFDGDLASDDFSLPQCSDGWSRKLHASYSNEVTQQQYEVALAASKQAEWDGEGLPPVGCECELVNFFGNDFPDFVGEPDEVVKIIGNGFTNGCPVAFYEADGGRGGMLAYAVAQCFRPIRNDAERKRDEAGLAIYHVINWNAEGELLSPSRMEDYKKAYDAIAAGKIPGIKLSD